MKALRLLWTSADRRSRRALVGGAVLAAGAEIAAAGLLGVSGWFLASCALVTAQANTTWSWMYPSGTVRSLALGRTGLRYTERLSSHRALLGASVRLRGRAVRASAALPPRELRSMRDGALLTYLTDDVAEVAALPARIIAPLTGIVATAAVVVALLAVVSPIAATAEVALLVVAAAVAVRANRDAAACRSEAVARRATARESLLSARSAWWELRCLDAVDPARDHVLRDIGGAQGSDAASLDALRRGRFRLRVSGAVGQAGILLLALSTATAIQPVADAVGEALLVAAGFELMEALPQILRDHELAGNAARRLSTLIALSSARLPGVAPGPTTDAALETPAVVVRGLPLGSQGSQVLARWSADLRSGSTTVVTGPNGSGKTTLLNILAGRIDTPDHAAVVLAGASVRDLSTREVSDRLTLVEAEEWLAQTTVADNLRQAAPDADDERLRAALTVAALEDLPLNSRTGPLGSALSQGQRRRLTVARAVLRNPAVLLLDEPVAGLDHSTAVRLLDGVRAALPDCVLVIALPDQHHDLVRFTVDATVRMIRA